MRCSSLGVDSKPARGAPPAALWPVLLVDSLEAYYALEPHDDAPLLRRRPSLFPPLLTPHAGSGIGSGKAPPQPRAGAVVENEAGLCAQMVAVQVAAAVRCRELCTEWRLTFSAGSTQAPHALPLAKWTHAQNGGYSFPLVQSAVPDHAVGAPLIFQCLMHNPAERQVVLEALGARWVLPARSAFSLAPLSRWAELARFRPDGGYRLVIADPPWHSASVARGGGYATIDRRALERELLPALSRLICADGCLLGFWVTNNRATQEFVEEALFPQLGARPISRLYWCKLAADGGWSTGVGPHSRHRKPWEVCCISYVGVGSPPALPPRLALCSLPMEHSVKPPLDAVLKPYTEQLSGGGSGAAATRPPRTADEAWRALPKLELFARELRPSWHAFGDEVLKYQHLDYYESTYYEL